MSEKPTPKILHKRVFIRRSGQVIYNISTQSLISEIKEGRLQKDDEISTDRKRWVRLDRHYQLARYFPAEPSSTSDPLPPGVDQRLTEVSELLRELS
ncbi:MAG: hypothetical protein QF502_07355 [Nitrospinaceae bacterium]|nr:hypothetical protein [Nitrospinaceae bacterium]